MATVPIFLMGDGTRSVPITLSSQKLNDDIYIDRQAEVAGPWEADHCDSERFGINRNPIGRLLIVAVAHNAFVEIVNRLFGANGDHVTGTKLIAGAGDLDSVDIKMAVDDTLSGLWAGFRQTGSPNYVVQPPFAEGQHLVAGVTFFGNDHAVVSPQLLLAEAVIMLDLLLLSRSQAPVGELPPLDVHTG